MLKKRLYYKTVNCGIRCENIKEGNLFFRNRLNEVEEMEKNGLEVAEQEFQVMVWMEELSRLELSAKNFEWSLLQDGYSQLAKLFTKLDRPEEALFCECKEYECGMGLMRYYTPHRVAEQAMKKQIELGRILTRIYKERRDVEKALYYINANMDYLISAQGIVNADKIDELFRIIVKDREEVTFSM